jgi:hypothetical protein
MSDSAVSPGRGNFMKMLCVTFACVIGLILTGCQTTRTTTELPIDKTSLPPSPAAAVVPAATSPLPPTETALPSPEVTLPSPTAVEPVYIRAFCTLIGQDPVISVPQGKPVVIIWGWEARTQELLNDYLQSNRTTVTLDGKVLEGTLSSEVTRNQKSGLPEAAWSSNAGILDAGKHSLTYDVIFSKMIDDGSSTYGPGGKVETIHDECQVIVR